MTKRRGFTLLEMVVAIMVISLLAGGLFLAGRAAISFFRGVNEKGDLGNVAKALEIYKNKYGEYPPDGTSREAIRRHLLTRYPNLLKDKTVNIDTLVTALYGNSQILTYWLCGEIWTSLDSSLFINEENRSKIRQTGESDIIDVKGGFKDASEAAGRRPQAGVNYNLSGAYLCNARGDRIVYFKSENIRANETTLYPIYDAATQALSETAMTAPYLRYCVLYDSSTTPPTWTAKWSEIPQSEGDPLKAYPWAKNNVWYASDTYQLILPGEDGVYNTPDDVTNFCSGKTMAEEEEN